MKINAKDDCVMDTKISIIIPTYKPQEYLKDCLLSLKNQTFKSYEILLILNGDKDPYESFILSTVEELGLNEKVGILYSERKGVSNARNLGLERAKGEYVCFIDDDDYVSPNYLEALLEVSSMECVGCSDSLSFIDGTNDYRENFLSIHFKNCVGKSYSQFVFRGFLSPPVAKLIHRSIIGKTRFNPNLAYSEDSVFCFDICPHIRDMRLSVSKCYYYIRVRRGSTTQKPFRFKIMMPQFLRMEANYAISYLRKPLAYDIRFVASRFVAALRNMWRYYIRTKKDHPHE